jgi:excisionase family DNA binding protein
VPDDVLMTTAETAELLRVHVDTLRRWRLSGYGPAYVRIGRTYRYWRSEVMAWLDENRPDAGPGHRGG